MKFFSLFKLNHTGSAQYDITQFSDSRFLSFVWWPRGMLCWHGGRHYPPRRCHHLLQAPVFISKIIYGFRKFLKFQNDFQFNINMRKKACTLSYKLNLYILIEFVLKTDISTKNQSLCIKLHLKIKLIFRHFDLFL